MVYPVTSPKLIHDINIAYREIVIVNIIHPQKFQYLGRTCVQIVHYLLLHNPLRLLFSHAR